MKKSLIYEEKSKYIAIQLRVNKGIHHEMKLRYQKKQKKKNNSKSKIEEIFKN